VPVYSNTEPVAITDADTLRDRLAAQIVSPVRWTETMRALVADGRATLLETGPGAVLTGLAKRIDGLAAYAAEQDGIDAVRTQERRTA
jgi:[acyl-carrier-protein] S-malonyltransferase